MKKGGEKKKKEESDKKKMKKRGKKWKENFKKKRKNNKKKKKEEKKGECKKDVNEFKAGIIEENELIKEAVLPDSDSVYKTEWNLAKIHSKTLERTFTGKMIVGWKLKSDHENDYGGYWERKSEVLGTSSYSFVVSSFRTRGCSWKLRVWVVDNVLPPELE